MKITDVEALHLRLPEVAEIADGTQDVLIVRVHTDSGLVGLGEVSSASYVARAIIEAPRSAQRRHGLREIIVAQDLDDVERLWERMYHHTNRYGRRGVALHAISGVDIALWDLLAKSLGKPLHELWGGARRTSVRAYASFLFGDTPAETERLGREAAARGLSAVKFGWGPFGKDPELDRAHVEAARRGAGDDCDLMVDAGCAWDVDTARTRVELLEAFGLAWLEEPLSQDDLDGYEDLCANSPIPIACGEGEVTRFGFEELIRRGVHILQPDVAICGGLTVCRQVSAACASAGRRAVPHCFSTGINLAASLHWIATVDDGDLTEYCLRPSPLLRDLVRDLPPLVDGRVPLPRGPGLGVELDEEVVDKYRVSPL